MKKVFIDGSAGTTGLRIFDRLQARSDIQLLTLPEAERKDEGRRRQLLNEADAAFLCLPDAAAEEAASWVENPDTVVLDTSTAHRTAPGWCYGFPELSALQEARIRQARRIAVPGCHASGFIALVYPLVAAGLLNKDALLSCYSLTGYSGGGKKMIAEYEAPARSALLDAPRQYALGQTHKHLKEMKQMTGLASEPVFCPVVSDFYSGMQVTVPLFAQWLKPGASMQDVRAVYQALYTGPVVSYTDAADAGGFLSAAALAGKDSMQIAVAGNEERMLLLAVYDNLGKGASGAAVECMNLVTGAEKDAGSGTVMREETQMKTIEGGVCAAQGFTAAGVHCGIRKNKTKRDLALIYSSVPASAAAVYTTNLVKGAPLVVTKQHLANGKAQAVICNSGNANTCNANGIEIAEQMSELLAQALQIQSSDVVVASTGVIGQPLDIAPIAAGIPELVKNLGPHSAEAAEGIMTTDTKRKEIAVSFTVGGKECRIGGICKGSGMIHPNMATMLVFITTDCAISPAMLQKALSTDIANTFNMVSVDGDTSTNDMVTVLANGLAGNAEITAEGEDFHGLHAGAQHRDGVSVPLHRGRRRGRDEAARVQGLGRGDAGHRQDRRQERHLLVSHKGGHVRRGRQLGPGAVCHRLFRRAGRRGQDRCAVCLESRDDPCVQGRRGRRFFRGRGQEDPA